MDRLLNWRRVPNPHFVVDHVDTATALKVIVMGHGASLDHDVGSTLMSYFTDLPLRFIHGGPPAPSPQPLNPSVRAVTMIGVHGYDTNVTGTSANVETWMTTEDPNCLRHATTYVFDRRNVRHGVHATTSSEHCYLDRWVYRDDYTIGFLGDRFCVADSDRLRRTETMMCPPEDRLRAKNMPFFAQCDSCCINGRLVKAVYGEMKPRPGAEPGRAGKGMFFSEMLGLIEAHYAPGLRDGRKMDVALWSCAGGRPAVVPVLALTTPGLMDEVVAALARNAIGQEQPLLAATFTAAIVGMGVELRLFNQRVNVEAVLLRYGNGLSPGQRDLAFNIAVAEHNYNKALGVGFVASTVHPHDAVDERGRRCFSQVGGLARPPGPGDGRAKRPGPELDPLTDALQACTPDNMRHLDSDEYEMHIVDIADAMVRCGWRSGGLIRGGAAGAPPRGLGGAGAPPRGLGAAAGVLALSTLWAALAGAATGWGRRSP